MKERPIIMTAESVRGILAGTKAQTRRIVKPQPAGLCRYEMNGAGTHALHLGPPMRPGETMSFVPPTPTSRDHRLPCPYGVAGDRLWVKESVAIRSDVDPATDLDKALRYLIHRADYRDGDLSLEWHNYGPGWRSPLFMPRWASRLTLEIVEVRVQRLQEISEDDGRAEGCEPGTSGGCRAAFVYRWEAINGKRAPWSSDPFVWAITFRRIP